MKKIENLLLLPVLLVLLTLLPDSMANIFISGGFTFYVIANSAVMPFVIGFLFLAFAFYKLIRRRHGAVDHRWAWGHIGGSFLLLAVFECCILYRGMAAWHLNTVTSDSYYTAYTYLVISQQVLIVTALLFVAIQIIFLLYFIIQLLKKSRLGQG
jgi:hypothetical protein